MDPYPHTYVASASAEGAGPVAVGSPKLPALETSAPAQFGGPGNVWSPETLLCASIADCFVLTFRAVARAARFRWLKLECRVEGVLERVEKTPQFTHYRTFATLTVPIGTDVATGRGLLERAEQGCLIANSLRGARALEHQIIATNLETAPLGEATELAS